MNTTKSSDVIYHGNYRDEDFADSFASALKAAIALCSKSKAQSSPIALCIGSDISVVDSFGPILGSELKNTSALKVYGTLERPVHLDNITYYSDNISYTFPSSIVIAVDSAKSPKDRLGDVFLLRGGICPGEALNRPIYPVGDITVICITEVISTNTQKAAKARLNEVIAMAKAAAQALDSAAKSERNRHGAYSL